MWIELQHHKTTNDILADHGFGIRESWQLDPVRLAEILQVDAVLSGRIEKMRYMSDLESYGVSLGVHIAREITQNAWWIVPGSLALSKEIRSEFALIEGGRGTTIWAFSDEVAADWSRRSEDIIEEITRKAARKFPYRL